MPDPKTAKSVAPLFRRKRTYVLLVVGLVCLATGLIAMGHTLLKRKRLEPLDARIRIAEPVTFGTAAKTLYRTQIEIAYSLNGEQYDVPISLPETANTREELQDLLRRHQSGSTIAVLYDPSQPAKVELASASGVYFVPLLLLAAGLIFLSFVFVAVAGDGKYQCPACAAGVAERHSFCFACGQKMPRRKGKMAQ